jgi:hypothetical protein
LLGFQIEWCMPSHLHLDKDLDLDSEHNLSVVLSGHAATRRLAAGTSPMRLSLIRFPVYPYEEIDGLMSFPVQS